MRTIALVTVLAVGGHAPQVRHHQQRMMTADQASVASAPRPAAQAGQQGPSSDVMQVPDWVNEITEDHGFGTQLGEFVAPGSRPDGEALDAFLDQAGFKSQPALNGWREFAVTYGARKNIGVQVALNESGTRLWVRLDLTIVASGFARRTVLMSKLQQDQPGGPREFRMVSGLLGLYLPLDTTGLSDANVHKAIRALVVQAERSAPIWVQRFGERTERCGLCPWMD